MNPNLHLGGAFVSVSVIEKREKTQSKSRGTTKVKSAPERPVASFAGLLNRADDLPISLLADLVNAVSDFVGTADATGGIIFLNPAARRILEIPPGEDIRGESVLRYNEIPTIEIQRVMDRAIGARSNEWTGTNVFVSRSGKRIPMSQTVVAHTTEGERCYSTIARDITEQIQAEEHLRWAADHDALTGLLNRTAFRSAVEEKSERMAVLVVLELENFKQVNDTYGHHVGDQVLQRAAWVLTDTLADQGIPARLGGDEFAATIFGDLSQQPAEVLAHLEKELHRHLSLFGVGVRIGTTNLDLDNEPLDLALQMADIDLYKRRPKNGAVATLANGGDHELATRRDRRSSHHRR